MNISLEKLARISWVTYLILALPVIIFCVWIDVLNIREWFIPDPGPLELPPQSLTMKTAIAVSTVLIPVFWLSGIVFGHRFNGRWIAIIPFLGSLLLVGCLTFIIYSVMRTEHNGWDGEFLYFAGLVVILSFGLICVVLTAIKDRQNKPDNKE